jgi:deazaflavin-dependent oxidoreductase (nitroreductase family)
MTVNETEIVDNQTGWVNEHIRSYVDSDGETGHTWRGVNTLLLTTLGRKSGQWRRTPLIYGQDGDRFVVVASKGGSPQHPAWYLNLADHPQVQVQVGADRFTARAHTASPEEKARLWPQMAKIWPEYDDYQQRTSRDIPVVVLERT